MVSTSAAVIHSDGRSAATSGDYARAASLFRAAADLAPSWPQPVYDLAFALLLSGDVEGARAAYGETLERAPRGFFCAITALHSLERERLGDLPRDTFKTYMLLEGMPEEQRVAFLRLLVQATPEFAPAWKDLAYLTNDPVECDEAINRGLAANPDAETLGVLRMNLALRMKTEGNRESAVRLLTEIAADPGTTASIEDMARHLLQSLGRE